MFEAYFNDLRFGPTVLRFDGSVIEVLRGVNHFRYHRFLVACAGPAGPDRKGNYQVDLVTRDRGAAAYTIVVDAAGVAQLHPVVAAIQAGG